ncbi:MAG: transcriptional regulator NrdR [Planctomycetota bacterium]|jgi:transcriptional repressor NrdR
MRCPYCKEDDDRVVNSRPSTDGSYVKRRRECNQCARRYTTYERIEMSVLRVVKKDGSREDFDLQKLLAGLNKACYKRPVPAERINELAADLERELHHRYDGEVPSRAIGELVMRKMRKLDQVAYIRFASVYREFTDVTDFVKEADSMLPAEGGSGRKGRSRRRGGPPAASKKTGKS